MKHTYLFLCLLILTGCGSYQQIAYVQEAGKRADLSENISSRVPETQIKVGDLLIITVNTNTPEAAVPFNLPIIPTGEASTSYGATNLSYGLSLQNFLVDMEGNIEYPVIGRIQAAGMTRSALQDYIKKAIYPNYIKDEPIIMVRYLNFKISVLGEVARPGTFKIDNDKVSLFEALALAGDLTIYGNRPNVLLVRENNGKRESYRIDLRDKDLIDSPFYYLQQNDVVYVEPNASRSRSSLIGSAESLSISIVGTLISLSSLIINILR